MNGTACHVCDRPAGDACERCELPTCDEHFHDQEFLGLCRTCQAELERLPADAVVQWPHRVRKFPPGLPETFEPPPMPT